MSDLENKLKHRRINVDQEQQQEKEKKVINDKKQLATWLSSTDDIDLSAFIRKSFDEKKRKAYQDKQQQTIDSKSSSNTWSTENLGWLVASAAAIYFSNIIHVIRYDVRVYRTFLVLSGLLIGVNILVACYLIIWLSYIKKQEPRNWYDNNPITIPIATGCFLAGILMLIVSLWPVYTWLTMPLLFTIFMGFIVIVINLPKF